MPRHSPAIGRLRPGVSCLIALTLLVVAPPARAHFLWLLAEPGDEGDGVVVRAFLAEPPVPDLPMFMEYIEDATYSAGGQTLEAERGAETFLVELPEATPEVIDGVCPLGLMTRDEETFRLFYTARVQFGPLPADRPESKDHLRVRLIGGVEGEPVVQVTFAGEPAAGAVVKAYFEDGDDRELTADERGRLSCPGVAEGTTALLAKWADGEAGELEGEAFGETRFYATLTVAPPAVAGRLGDSAATAALREVRTLAPLPEPTNSFGGAVLGDWLYVYSGHTGTTHRYHTGTTLPHFRRLDLRDDGATWEELPRGPAVQGVSLVAHDGMLYRVGGMSARNGDGEPHDLVSIADVARFDPDSKTWTDLPPLPEPRSTHDAAVIGDHLYVAGGWAMLGGDSSNTFFHEDALRLDLTDPETGWEPLPTPPFLRRALAAAAHDGKLFVIGGLTEGGDVVRDVDVYDPATGEWSEGPELPGEEYVGFAPSAFEVGGRLFASGIDGVVHRLDEAGAAWEAVGRLAVPRITHRLLPHPDGDLLIVGGNFAGRPVRFVERFDPESGGDGPVMIAGTLAIESDAVKSQAVAWHKGGLLVAGGSSTWRPHAFEPEYLADAVHRVALGALDVRPAGTLPTPLQSGTLVAVPSGRRGVPHLLGGIGSDGEVVRTLGAVHRLDPEGERWVACDASIPDDRGMFGAAVDDEDVWIFGGSIFDPRPGREGRALPVDVLRWRSGQEGATFEATGHQIPTARRSFAGAVLDRKYYIVGGIGGGMGLIDAVDVFDFETETWGTIPAPEHPRLFADLVPLDGALYLAGGFSRPDGGHFEPNRSVERFDPESGTWATVIDEIPLASTDTRMVAVGDRLLFFGVDPDADGRSRFALVAP